MVVCCGERPSPRFPLDVIPLLISLLFGGSQELQLTRGRGVKSNPEDRSDDLLSFFCARYGFRLRVALHCFIFPVRQSCWALLASRLAR